MIAPTTMLYRAAEQPNDEVWGLSVEHRPFDDADVPAALAEGWALHPLDVGADEAVTAAEPKRRGRPPKEG